MADNEKLTCPICGEPTNVYMGHARKDRLCRVHGRMANAGEIRKCEICGSWHQTNESCDCQEFEETIDDAEEEITGQCLLCENEAGPYLFCRSCYYKYKDRSIDIRITNCRDITILDEYGNLTIECDDGRKVRSRAEALISNFLYNNKIRSVYEKTIYYKENDENKTLHPDFYLPDYDVYIEYNEIKKKSYLKSKEYTQSIYKRLGFNVIIMDDKDLNSIAGCLKPQLGIN